MYGYMQAECAGPPGPSAQARQSWSLRCTERYFSIINDDAKFTEGQPPLWSSSWCYGYRRGVHFKMHNIGFLLQESPWEVPDHTPHRS